MNDSILILYLEDNPLDYEMVSEYLNDYEKSITVKNVSDKNSFISEFHTSKYDLILSDYSMPDYDGLSALKFVRELSLDIPFILISGAIGEEKAIECMREGATDYVLKHNYNRLGPIVERAVNEYELKINEKQHKNMLQAVLQSIPIGVGLYQHGKYQWINEEFYHICGYCLGELNQIKRSELFEDNLAFLDENYIHDTKTQTTYSIATKIITKTKKYKDCHVRVRFLDVKDVTKGMVISIENTSLQIQMIDALKDEEAFFASLVEHIPMNIIRKDLKSRITFNNQNCSQLFGRTKDNVIGKSDTDLFPKELAEQYIADDRFVIETGKKKDLIEETVDSQGNKIFIHTIKTPVLDGNNQTVGVQLLFWDVTNIVLKDKKIQQLYQALEQSPASVVITNIQGNLEYVNPTFLELTGYTIKEVIGQNPRILKSGEQSDEFYQEMWQTISTGNTWRGKICNRKKNGELYWELASISPILDDNGNITSYVGVKEDITKELIIQEEIKQSERFSTGILNSLTAHIAILDENGTITHVNNAWIQFAKENGMECVDNTPCCVGKNYFEICEVVAGLDCAESQDALNVLKGLHEMIQGTIDEFYYEYPCHSPTEKRWFNLKVSKLNLQGQNNIVLAHENITQQKKLEEMLFQSQKMEAVGRLAGGIAHDFNNLLMVIKSYSSFVLDSLEPDSDVYEDMNEIKGAADRASALTRQLLAFSRQQVLEPKVIQLNDIVKDINKMIHRLIGEDIDYRTTLDPLLKNIKVDPGQIEQIFVNLVVNARDAMPNGGTIQVETENAVLDDTYCSSHPEVKPGNYVMLSLSDTGIGMDDNVKDKMFEPFFTTKSKGKGTGLGLSTIFGIVKQSKGHIYVYSELGKGTSFKIYFPSYKQNREETIQSESTQRKPLIEKKTILLVEDEGSVLKAVSRILKQSGFLVLTAESPSEGISIFKDNKEGIDLIVSDVIMPEMNGIEMYDQIQSIYPKVKILFMSGYTNNAIVSIGILHEGLTHIQKPFSSEALLRKIDLLLDSDNGVKENEI